MTKIPITAITGQTSDKDAYYVYVLYDKVTNKPFYVGKGKGERLLQHEHDANRLKELVEKGQIQSDKLETILKHGVEPVIVKFGLTQDEAFYAESALINAFDYHLAKTQDLPLTNKVKGRSTKREKSSYSKDMLTKARSLDNFLDNYRIETFDASTLTDSCVFIRINQSYQKDDTVETVYDKVRGVWRIAKKHLPHLKYAFALYNGVCVGVYRINGWKTAHEWDDDYPFPKRDDTNEQDLVRYDNIDTLKEERPDLYRRYFDNVCCFGNEELTKWRNKVFFYGDTNVPKTLQKAVGKIIVNIPKESGGYKKLNNQGSIIYNDIA